MAEAEAEFRDNLGRTLFQTEVFAEALEQCNSKEARKECLSKAIDVLLMNHSVIFIDIIKELETRNLTATHWTEYPIASIPFEKVYKSLMMVTAKDMVGKKEKFVDKLKDLLQHSVKNMNNPLMTLKICAALEINPVLRTVYECLLEPIEQTKKKFNHFEACTEDIATSLHTSNDELNFEEFKTELVNKKLDCYKSFDEFPEFQFEYFGDNYVDKMVAKIAAHRSIPPKNQNIVIQKMDKVIADWLDHLHITKYQWFFNSLSYHEIVNLDERNIKSTISKVNSLHKNGNSIKEGIQRRICAATKELKIRQLKLDSIKSALTNIDEYPDVWQINAYVKYMKKILCYPIPNEICAKDNQVLEDLSFTMSLICVALLRWLNDNKILKGHSMLAATIKIYYECLTMIARNQAFMADDVIKMDDHARTLMKQIRSMRRDFD